MQHLHNEAAVNEDGLYRIGAVSRLAGVPVSTLRMWESRYAAFRPGKSEGRHRLYAEADVVKARVLRQLVQSGHSIGRIAGLDADKLLQMLSMAESSSSGEAANTRRPSITAVVVGNGIAARLAASGWRSRFPDARVNVLGVYVNLGEALQAALPPAESGAPDLLLVKLNTVHPATFGELSAVAARLGVRRVVVAYNFGAESTVEALRAAGMLVRREPVPDAEFAELIRSVMVVDPARSMAGFSPGLLIPPRRFSDTTLATVAASPGNVLCECPRHIADLIGQLASFEQYSHECLNKSDDDARLHAYLRSVAGSARALFEHALQLVADHGGVTLPQEPVTPDFQPLTIQP